MILSLQSNVMHGYVGNRASLPLYQAFGIETAHLDTVRLAAHPGHGTKARDILDGQMMAALFEDYLTLPDAMQPQALHIGYFGAQEQIEVTAAFITELKQRYRDLIILLDPVFGDHGRAYISDDIITSVTQKLLPLADILTPNQFELGLLSGRTLTDIAGAEKALEIIANTGGQTIIATGISSGISSGDNVYDMIIDNGYIYKQSASKKAHGVSGSGDAFAALFLAHILSNYSKQDALYGASSLTHHMIQNSESPLTLNIASGLAEIQNRNL